MLITTNMSDQGNTNTSPCQVCGEEECPMIAVRCPRCEYLTLECALQDSCIDCSKTVLGFRLPYPSGGILGKNPSIEIGDN